MSDLSKFKPLQGYIIVKDISKDQNNSVIKYAGDSESRSYGRVVATWDMKAIDSGLNPTKKNSKLLGKLVVFSEFAGQELEKFKGILDEEDLLIMKEDEVICIINE